MNTSDFVLYSIWSLVPIFFYGMWLWCTLEKLSRRKVEMDVKFLWRQAGFTLTCTVMTILLDKYWLRDFEVPFLQDLLPHWFWRLLLFPAVLLVMAHLVGATKGIMITQGSKKVGTGNPRTKGR